MGIGQECGEVLGAVLENETELRLRELIPKEARNVHHQLLLHPEQVAQVASLSRGRAYLSRARHHTRLHARGASWGYRHQSLHQSSRSNQVPDASSCGRVDSARLGEPELLDQHADLQSLHHGEAAQQREIGGKDLRQSPSQRAVHGISHDVDRQHRDRRGIARRSPQLGLARQGQASVGHRAVAPGNALPRPHRRGSGPIGVILQVPRVDGEGLVVFLDALQAATHDEWAQRTVRPPLHARPRHDCRSVAPIRGVQRGRIAKQRVAIVRVRG